MDEDPSAAQAIQPAEVIINSPASVEDTQSTEVIATSEPSDTQQDATPQASAPAVDEELKKYADSNGIELDSPGAIKAAQIARKQASEASRNYQKANELEKGMNEMGDASAEHTAQATGQDPELLKRLQRMEIKNSISEFYSKNPDAPQFENRMNEIAQTAGLYGTPEAILKAAYAMAKAEAPDNSAEVSNQGAVKALQNLAQKQQAAVPTGHATTNAGPKEKDFRTLSHEERRAKLGVVRPG